MLGTPKPTLQWFKDDMEVFSSERLDIKEEEDGGNVIVREVRDILHSLFKPSQSKKPYHKMQPPN